MNIVETLVSSITSLLTGLGSGISTGFQNLFTTGTGETMALNPLAITILTLAGVSVAMGLFGWIKSIIHK